MHKDVQSVPLCVRDVDVIYVKLRGGLFDDGGDDATSNYWISSG